MKPWQHRLEAALSPPDAPAVLTRDLLERFARSARDNAPIPSSSLTWWIRSAVAASRLQPVQRGLYLNGFRNRAAGCADAVPWLHRDAVVSLNTVLGDAGVLNNPTEVVTSVVPFDPGAPPPRLGRRKAGRCTFHFFGMPRRVLEAGDPDDRLDDLADRDHARATPEKALIDWLYLGASPRSRRTPPPRSDMDVSMLNLVRLRRLAKAAGLGELLERWLKT